jgi:hypothetical protein
MKKLETIFFMSVDIITIGMVNVTAWYREDRNGFKRVA